MSLVEVSKELSIVRPMSIRLQKRDINISDACSTIHITIRDLRDIRDNLDSVFVNLFKDAEHLLVKTSKLL